MMQAVRSRPAVRRGSIVWLPAEEIAPNPVQPRKAFEDKALEELSQSIRSYGILNPLTVRCRGGKYELVAGERRLRAAKLAGLTEVPCILLDVNMEDASLIALVENLQRKDLDFIEEAIGLSRLIRMFGLSQEEAARRIGKSQSAVANKLRLLKLPRDVLEGLRDRGLTERHGRALLRLSDPNAQRMALAYIADNALSVAAAESYIEALLSDPVQTGEGRPEPRRSLILKDVRVFLNSLNHSLSVMKQGGIDAGLKREETEEALILTISIPKERAAAMPPVQGAQAQSKFSLPAPSSK